MLSAGGGTAAPMGQSPVKAGAPACGFQLSDPHHPVGKLGAESLIIHALNNKLCDLLANKMYIFMFEEMRRAAKKGIKETGVNLMTENIY